MRRTRRAIVAKCGLMKNEFKTCNAGFRLAVRENGPKQTKNRIATEIPRTPKNGRSIQGEKNQHYSF